MRGWILATRLICAARCCAVYPLRTRLTSVAIASRARFYATDSCRSEFCLSRSKFSARPDLGFGGGLNLPTCRGFLLARRNFIYVWQTKPEPPPSRVKICLPAADRIYVLLLQAEILTTAFYLPPPSPARGFIKFIGSQRVA